MRWNFMLIAFLLSIVLAFCVSCNDDGDTPDTGLPRDPAAEDGGDDYSGDE